MVSVGSKTGVTGACLRCPVTVRDGYVLVLALRWNELHGPRSYDAGDREHRSGLGPFLVLDTSKQLSPPIQTFSLW